MTAKEILELYDEIVINEETEAGFLITLFKKEFFIFTAHLHEPESVVFVLLRDDKFFDFPHIMLRDIDHSLLKNIPEGNYRWICLYENESVVHTLISFEDKIIDAVNRLIELLSMNDAEKEREYRKEFMYYWNDESSVNSYYHVYLSQEDTFAEMMVYHGKNNVRLVDKNLRLSDIDSRNKDERNWIHHLENDAYFIPLADSRGIIPPHRGCKWTVKSLKDLVCAKQIEHINNDDFQQLLTTFPRTQKIILVFGMNTGQSHITFALMVEFNNTVGLSLLEMIRNHIKNVEPLYTFRKDYLYLNKQIGNDLEMLKKKILVIGAGSLGSYVSFELVKNGAASIRIYDADRLEHENILRWSYGAFGIGDYKPNIIETWLNHLHPEIDVMSFNTNIDDQSLVREASNVDLIIFTVGSSDVQLKFNRVLEDACCSIPTIYAWLESGGDFSHILVVDYQKAGCFECLYTDETGNLVNNRARMNNDAENNSSLIGNGCGGTRAAYGTTVLLRTTAAILGTIQKIWNKSITDSVLIDITPEVVRISDTKFPVEACKCCGDRNKQ